MALSSSTDDDVHPLEVVGGHASKQDKKSPPFLVRGSFVFKPFQGKHSGLSISRGEIEAEFYKSATDSNLPIVNFAPTYYGVECLDNQRYLKLENVLAGIKDTCILDLKMGQQAYGEMATPCKIARELQKYPAQKDIGFRCCGMKVVRPANGEIWKASREWCLSISLHSLQESIEQFFWDGKALRYDLVSLLLKKLNDIEVMLRVRPTWRMYGSSLLIVYDASEVLSSSIRVKMIDFTNIFPIEDGGLDYGYLHGINCLQKCLRSTLSSIVPDSVNTVDTTSHQVGGHRNSIELHFDGNLIKKEHCIERFETEVAFYRDAWGSQTDTPDSLSRIMPKLISVDESKSPRLIVLSNVSALVVPPLPHLSHKKFVSTMDIKLGKRSFNRNCQNDGKEIYFTKYSALREFFGATHTEFSWEGLHQENGEFESLAIGKLGKRDYLAFRDRTTTSSNLGFRITALNHVNFTISQQQARHLSNRKHVMEHLERFLSNHDGFNVELALKFMENMMEVHEAIAESRIINEYEIVGSSLLFVHCEGRAAIRWIDFANFRPVDSADQNGILEGVEELSLAIKELIANNACI